MLSEMCLSWMNTFNNSLTTKIKIQPQRERSSRNVRTKAAVTACDFLHDKSTKAFCRVFKDPQTPCRNVKDNHIFITRFLLFHLPNEMPVDVNMTVAL